VDGTGSLISVRRHDYLPFGEEVTVGMGNGSIRTGGGMGYAADSVRQKFGSKERDNETGLYYFLARYYSDIQGRFTSLDIPFQDQNPKNPQSWGLYAYVRNNPLKFTDPTGNSCYYYNNNKLGCDGDKGLKVDGSTLYYNDQGGKARTADLNYLKVQEEIPAGPNTPQDYIAGVQLRAPALKQAIGIAAIPDVVLATFFTGGAALNMGGGGLTSLGISSWPAMTNVAGASGGFGVLYRFIDGLPSVGNLPNAIVLNLHLENWSWEINRLWLTQQIVQRTPFMLDSVKLVEDGKLTTLGLEVDFLLNHGYRLATSPSGLMLIPK